MFTNMVLFKVTLVFTAAWLLTLALRRQSASHRHLVWVLALAGALLLPVMEWSLPKRLVARQLPSAIAAAQSITVYANRTQSQLALPATLLWSLGSALLLFRVAAKRTHLSRIVADARPVGRFGPIRIRVTRALQSPGVAGTLRPAILLPEDYSHWAPITRRSVFTHEIAHIRRRDGLTLLLAEIVRAMYWFHPLVWIAFSKMQNEAELACDDAAIRRGLRPSSYARQLLQLARTFTLQPAIPMATTSQLEYRMKAILNPEIKRNEANHRTWLVAATATLAILAPLSSFTLLAQDQNQARADKLAAEAAAQSQNKPVRVGGNVMQANLIQKVTPNYPADAKERRIQGKVTLGVIIDKDGVPTNITVQSPDTDASLNAAAVEAVSQWRYRPTLLNGEPVEVITTIDVNFTLAQ